MKKILINSIAILGAIMPCYAGTALASVTDNLAGSYACTGYDKQDKALSCSLTITLNAKNSILENGYGAYNLTMVAPPSMIVEGLPPNIAATGSIASNGNTFAMSFKNTNPKAPTDYGTAIGVVTHDQDEKGVTHTKLHFFSYQSAYKGGDNSVWICVKN